MRSVTENLVGLADFPRRQGSSPKWDSATSQMSRPGWIIIVSEATKLGDGCSVGEGHDLFLFQNSFSIRNSSRYTG